MVERLISDGIENHFKGDRVKYESARILLDKDVELALAYWNANLPTPNGSGTGSRINFREAEVRK
jgi:hypothetical protein